MQLGDLRLTLVNGGNFRLDGGAMHGVQIWLALPEANEDDAPSFEHHPEATLPAIAPSDGVRGRVLIGAAFGVRSPIRHPSDPLLVDLRLDPGASIEIPAEVPADVPAGIAERAVFVIDGELRAGSETLAANRLERKGLARRQGAPRDRRTVLLALTPKGRHLIDTLMAEDLERHELLLAPLAPARRTEVLDGLAEILHRLIETREPS